MPRLCIHKRGCHVTILSNPLCHTIHSLMFHTFQASTPTTTPDTSFHLALGFLGLRWEGWEVWGAGSIPDEQVRMA